MIQISEAAANKIKQVKVDEGKSTEDFLRVTVKRGGCSGFSYKLDFDTVKKDDDKSFESHGTSLVIDSQSLLYLVGMTLDFEGGLNGAGFVFSNPNATKTCGCGASFAV